MKKKFMALPAIFVGLFFTFSNFNAAAQKIEKRKITPEELKEWNNTTVAENVLSKISVAERSKTNDEAHAIAAYVLKAMLHRIDPLTYPIDDKPGSVEKIALEAIDKFSPSTLKKAKARTNILMANVQKKSKLLGKLKDLDFKKKLITPEIKRISKIEFKPVIRTVQDGAFLNTDQSNVQFIGVGGSSSGNYENNNVPVFNKLDLVLRKVHCVDETEPEGGDDDMVIGGLLVGASGNTNSANSFASGHYDDGEVTNHGSYPFGTYSLKSTSGYPKVFYCILQLIEVDTDEADAAKVLTDVMTLVGAMVSTVNPVIGGLVVAVAQVVQIFTSWLIDDDPFYPYGVSLNLNSPNIFGADGRSSDWHTGNISDHGGTYRAGFYWQLKN
ncbi:MAG: hypothetical protein ABIP79_10005 [Chitinophagaceae bacterium]